MVETQKMTKIQNIKASDMKMTFHYPKCYQKRGAERGADFQNIGCAFCTHIQPLKASKHSNFHFILQLLTNIHFKAPAPLSAPLFFKFNFPNIHTYTISQMKKACPHDHFSLFIVYFAHIRKKHVIWGDFGWFGVQKSDPNYKKWPLRVMWSIRS